MSEEAEEKPSMDGLSGIFRSEEFRTAGNRYHEAFDNMPEEKRHIIKMMMMCWQTAWNAYNAAMGYNGEDTDDKRIMCCGTHANTFLMQFGAIQNELGNESAESVLKKMNATSDWLQQRGLHGLPTPVDRDNVVHHKTAERMYADMKRYSETRLQLVQRMRASGDEGGSGRRR